MKLVLITLSLLLIPNLLAKRPPPNGQGCPRCKKVEGNGDLAGTYYFHRENNECENGCSYERDDGECCFCFAPGNYSVTKCDHVNFGYIPCSNCENCIIKTKPSLGGQNPFYPNCTGGWTCCTGATTGSGCCIPPGVTCIGGEYGTCSKLAYTPAIDTDDMSAISTPGPGCQLFSTQIVYFRYIDNYSYFHIKCQGNTALNGFELKDVGDDGYATDYVCCTLQNTVTATSSMPTPQTPYTHQSTSILALTNQHVDCGNRAVIKRYRLMPDVDNELLNYDVDCDQTNPFPANCQRYDTNTVRGTTIYSPTDLTVQCPDPALPFMQSFQLQSTADTSIFYTFVCCAA